MGQSGSCGLCGPMKDHRITDLIEEKEIMQLHIESLEKEVRELNEQLTGAKKEIQMEDDKWETTREELELVRAEITSMREESQLRSPFDRPAGGVMFYTPPASPLNLSGNDDSAFKAVSTSVSDGDGDGDVEDGGGVPHDPVIAYNTSSCVLEAALRNAESQIESSVRTRQSFAPKSSAPVLV
eukprot:TRINITY_DN5824_c1_g1_i1.p1 TRINITY_DN5824_c1_g1~~TRINITY_DN5824_c1_g1_i1.p1  ORF type:complete len:197 (+),score=44.44 TRINITY_DN5824_c1_g1_i1:43-591(+)